MSRHLFTLTVAAPDFLDELERSHARGQPISPLLASPTHAARIAFFAIVFDGWSNTIVDLRNSSTTSWRSVIQLLTRNEYGCTRLVPDQLKE